MTVDPDRDKFFIQPEVLADRLTDPSLKIVDGSWHMPNAGRDARAEFEATHIPGAVFFDIDAISDQATDLPHMLPPPAVFAEAVSEMGLSETDDIIVYDTLGLFSAPRVWWTFRVMGAKNVRILDGGLPLWQEAGLPVSDRPAAPKKAKFNPDFIPEKVRDLAYMRAASRSASCTILDARPEARFTGAAPEPRPGLPSGHMPGSLSLPFIELIQEGRLKQAAELRALFGALGIDGGTPIVTTCGSGVTAAILTLGLAAAGVDETSLYDGAWSEWAAQKDAPIRTGRITLP